MKKHHSSTKIPIQFADVDDRILPLVKWFNSIEGIQTDSSCEGVGKEAVIEQSYHPYVSFFTNSLDAVRKIAAILSEFRDWRTPFVYDESLKANVQNGPWVRMETHYNFNQDLSPSLSFAVYFEDQQTMLLFAKYVRRWHPIKRMI